MTSDSTFYVFYDFYVSDIPMKRLVQRLIQAQAKKILAAYRPAVVAVTGSVGKTSARNAIAAVLGARFRVGVPPGNYNNEFGVPLAVIGATSPGRSVRGWLRVLWKAQRLLWRRDPAYPSLLVLEYGADKPGDIAALCRFAAPDAAVWTSVSPVHAANYPSVERLAQEKAEIIRCAKPSGEAFLNADDAAVMAHRAQAAVPTRTYGLSPNADVRAENVEADAPPRAAYAPADAPFSAATFDLAVGGDRAAVRLPGAVGRTAVSAALAAAAVGLRFGLSLREIAARLADVKTEPGRLRPLAGVKGCLVLDDTYNAAPAAMAAALDALARWPVADGARRIAALGHMAELGALSEQEHRLVGMQAATSCDALVVAGEMARDIARGAREAGMDAEHVVEVKDAIEAGRWLDAHVRAGDVVLVKGSQSARMEKAAKDILAEPDRAAELLPRQYGKWVED